MPQIAVRQCDEFFECIMCLIRERSKGGGLFNLRILLTKPQ